MVMFKDVCYKPTYLFMIPREAKISRALVVCACQYDFDLLLSLMSITDGRNSWDFLTPENGSSKTRASNLEIESVDKKLFFHYFMKLQTCVNIVYNFFSLRQRLWEQIRQSGCPWEIFEAGRP